MRFKERAPRFQTEKIPVSLRKVGTFAWTRGTVLNLSATGIQFFCATKLEEGDFVDLEFITVNRAGSRVKRKLRAKIAWGTGSRYGAAFMKPSKPS